MKKIIEGPAIVAVSRFSSEVGKAKLMCDFLRAFLSWEGKKAARGF
jgi:hypothetical protein